MLMAIISTEHGHRVLNRANSIYFRPATDFQFPFWPTGHIAASLASALHLLWLTRIRVSSTSKHSHLSTVQRCHSWFRILRFGLRLTGEARKQSGCQWIGENETNSHRGIDSSIISARLIGSIWFADNERFVSWINLIEIWVRQFRTTCFRQPLSRCRQPRPKSEEGKRVGKNWRDNRAAPSPISIDFVRVFEVCHLFRLLSFVISSCLSLHFSFLVVLV
jgi:hypothetical protein